MKIKLKRELWNAKKGDIIDQPKDRAEWAINRGLAELVKEPKKAKQDGEAKSN